MPQRQDDEGLPSLAALLDESQGEGDMAVPHYLPPEEVEPGLLSMNAKGRAYSDRAGPPPDTKHHRYSPPVEDSEASSDEAEVRKALRRVAGSPPPREDAEAKSPLSDTLAVGAAPPAAPPVDRDNGQPPSPKRQRRPPLLEGTPQLVDDGRLGWLESAPEGTVPHGHPVPPLDPPGKPMKVAPKQPPLLASPRGLASHESPLRSPRRMMKSPPNTPPKLSVKQTSSTPVTPPITPRGSPKRPDSPSALSAPSPAGSWRQGSPPDSRRGSIKSAPASRRGSAMGSVKTPPTTPRRSSLKHPGRIPTTKEPPSSPPHAPPPPSSEPEKAASRPPSTTPFEKPPMDPRHPHAPLRAKVPIEPDAPSIHALAKPPQPFAPRTVEHSYSAEDEEPLVPPKPQERVLRTPATPPGVENDTPKGTQLPYPLPTDQGIDTAPPLHRFPHPVPHIAGGRLPQRFAEVPPVRSVRHSTASVSPPGMQPSPPRPPPEVMAPVKDSLSIPYGEPLEEQYHHLAIREQRERERSVLQETRTPPVFWHSPLRHRDSRPLSPSSPRSPPRKSDPSPTVYHATGKDLPPPPMFISEQLAIYRPHGSKMGGLGRRPPSPPMLWPVPRDPPAFAMKRVGVRNAEGEAVWEDPGKGRGFYLLPPLEERSSHLPPRVRDTSAHFPYGTPDDTLLAEEEVLVIVDPTRSPSPPAYISPHLGNTHRGPTPPTFSSFNRPGPPLLTPLAPTFASGSPSPPRGGSPSGLVSSPPASPALPARHQQYQGYVPPPTTFTPSKPVLVPPPQPLQPAAASGAETVPLAPHQPQQPVSPSPTSLDGKLPPPPPQPLQPNSPSSASLDAKAPLHQPLQPLSPVSSSPSQLPQPHPTSPTSVSGSPGRTRAKRPPSRPPTEVERSTSPVRSPLSDTSSRPFPSPGRKAPPKPPPVTEPRTTDSAPQGKAAPVMAKETAPGIPKAEDSNMEVESNRGSSRSPTPMNRTPHSPAGTAPVSDHSTLEEPQPAAGGVATVEAVTFAVAPNQNATFKRGAGTGVVLFGLGCGSPVPCSQVEYREDGSLMLPDSSHCVNLPPPPDFASVANRLRDLLDEAGVAHNIPRGLEDRHAPVFSPKMSKIDAMHSREEKCCVLL